MNNKNGACAPFLLEEHNRTRIFIRVTKHKDQLFWLFCARRGTLLA